MEGRQELRRNFKPKSFYSMSSKTADPATLEIPLLTLFTEADVYALERYIQDDKLNVGWTAGFKIEFFRPKSFH
jgi:hypothetical protein